VFLVSRALVLDSPELWSRFLRSRILFLQIQLVFSLEVLPVSIFATQSEEREAKDFPIQFVLGISQSVFPCAPTRAKSRSVFSASLRLRVVPSPLVLF
jgi:hypothetical protein